MQRHSGAVTVGFANIAHTFAHLFTLLFATVVLVLEREWPLSFAELFALSLPMTVMFGAAALPAGWLADRWSAPGMIVIFFIGIGGASVLTGFSETPFGIAIGLTLIGTFAAIYHPVGIPWLVKNATNRGRALGINGVFGAAGTAGAAIVAGILIDYYSWRAAFVVPGIIAMLTGLAFFGAMRAGLIHEAVEDAKPDVPANHSDRRRAFVALAVTVLCTGLIFQVTTFALPKIFSERLGGLFTDGMIGIGGLVSAVYVVSALAQIVGGELADRRRLKTVYMTFQFLQLPVLAAALVLYSPALVPVAALMVCLNVAGQPAENALLARYAPPSWRGRAFGAKFVLTLGVSAGGVALIPIIHGLTGRLDYLFVALFLFAAIAAVAALGLPNEGRERAAVPVAAE
jgi:MFS family permease